MSRNGAIYFVVEGAGRGGGDISRTGKGKYGKCCWRGCRGTNVQQ
jgi:hypothetical protein